MNKAACEHASERRADKAEEIVNAACGAAAGRGYSLAQKGGEYRLVQAVAEEECAAADVKEEIVMGAKQIDRVTDGDSQPTNQNRHTKPS